jgi:hypothetical protein
MMEQWLGLLMLAGEGLIVWCYRKSNKSFESQMEKTFTVHLGPAISMNSLK